jgi:predicted PurR-regulated permease PerM
MRAARRHLGRVSTHASRPAWIAYGVLLSASLLLLAAVGLPLWEPLLVAAVLAAALRGLHRRLAALLWGRRAIAAWLLLFGVVLLVLLPIATVTWQGVEQAHAAVEFIGDALRSGRLPHLADELPGPFGSVIQDELRHLPETLDRLRKTYLTPESGVATAAVLGGAVSWGVRLFVKALVMLIALYFLLLDGEDLIAWLGAVLPLPEGQAARLLGDFALMSRSVLGSMLVSSLSQGTAATIGFLIARVPQPFFFGLLTFFMSFVPSIGTGVVGLPIAAILVLAGHVAAGVFLAAWTLLVVGLVDNLFRPLIIKGRVQVHGAVIFFSLLGGLSLLGPVGLLVGPLAVSFFLAMVHMRTAQAQAPAIARREVVEEERVEH